MKGEEFMLNNENIKQEQGMQLSFSEIQLKNEHFWAKKNLIEVLIFNTC